MRMLESTGLIISAHFGKVRQPVAHPTVAACMQIASLRQKMIQHAELNDGFIFDKAGCRQRVKDTYNPDILAMAELFDSIQHGERLYTYCGALSREAARIKTHPDIMQMRQEWQSLSASQKLAALRVLSTHMVDVLNKSQYSLCLNYPVITMATYPEASRDRIAMQVAKYEPFKRDVDDDKGISLSHISVNRDKPSLNNFDATVAMLWHEHIHMYMQGMRACLHEGYLRSNHPLYEEISKSDLIQKYKITGNFSYAEKLYYAEPEEKLCYFAQNIFQTVFRYIPAQDMGLAYG